MSALILIIEDEVDLAAAIEFRLQTDGFDTAKAHLGAEGLNLARQTPAPDLIILDLMLPDISGIEVCKQLQQERRTARIPVLMLTAKGEEVDRVVGFEVGADDYLVKPCSMRELVLRIRAILRRVTVERGPQEEQEEQEEKVSFGCLRIDLAAHRVWVEEEEITLTALEFRLLTTFLHRRGRVQSRDTLLEDVWGYNTGVTTRTVDTHIKRLRLKLKSAGHYVETLRGVGYRFREDPPEGDR